LKIIKSVLLNKEFRTVLFNQFIIIIGTFGLIKILTTLLSKEDYGYYTLSISIVALISMLPFSAFDQAVSRYISIYKINSNYTKMYSNILFLYMIIFGIYILIYIGLKSFFYLDDPWNGLSNVLLFYVLFYTLVNTTKAIEKANRKRSQVLLADTFDLVMKISALLILWKINKLDIITLFILFGIIAMSITLYLTVHENKFSVTKIDYVVTRKIASELFSFSYPLILWASFGWLQNMINRWYLNYFVDTESVAEYSLMSSLILTGINAFSGVINSYIIPIIYQKENSENGFANKTIIKLLPIVIGFYAVVFVILLFFNKQIISLVSDSSYTESAWMLPLMFLAGALYSVGMMSTFEIYSDKKTNKLILSSIIPGLFSLVAGYFLIRDYGSMGAVISFMISYGLYGILTLRVSYKYGRYKKLSNS
jgi:O-antigen/teichoic acid export membrane protein